MSPSLLVLATLVACALGHGRVLAPPSRASAWRVGFPTRQDYDDDGANCGGFSMQWSVNGGKCGICGDAYNIRPPRPHEIGGLFGEGIIVAHYAPGSLMTTTVELTTSHLGFWEFKLCTDPITNNQECFDDHVLELEGGGTKFYPVEGSKKYNVTYRLPPGLVCEHCVLQWRYTAGNNWGICSNGTQGLGCGNQEQFGACSDIYIGPDMFPMYYYLNNGVFSDQKGFLDLFDNDIFPSVTDEIWPHSEAIETTTKEEFTADDLVWDTIKQRVSEKTRQLKALEKTNAYNKDHGSNAIDLENYNKINDNEASASVFHELAKISNDRGKYDSKHGWLNDLNFNNHNDVSKLIDKLSGTSITTAHSLNNHKQLPQDINNNIHINNKLAFNSHKPIPEDIDIHDVHVNYTLSLNKRKPQDMNIYNHHLNDKLLDKHKEKSKHNRVDDKYSDQLINTISYYQDTEQTEETSTILPDYETTEFYTESEEIFTTENIPRYYKYEYPRSKKHQRNHRNQKGRNFKSKRYKERRRKRRKHKHKKSRKPRRRKKKVTPTARYSYLYERMSLQRR